MLKVKSKTVSKNIAITMTIDCRFLEKLNAMNIQNMASYDYLPPLIRLTNVSGATRAALQLDEAEDRTMGTTVWLLCLLALAAHSSAHKTGAMLPPEIVVQPPAGVQTFKDDENFTLNCEASGNPAPKYKWIKDGRAFDPANYTDRMSLLPGSGSFVVNKPKDEDEGQYQCFASNKLGTATSNSVFVRKAMLNSFSGSSQNLTVNEGEPFNLSCTPPDSWPKANVYWVSEGNQHPEIIKDDRRTFDPMGTLWFSYVTSEDAKDIFKCTARNKFINNQKFGYPVYLKVKSSNTEETAPQKQYTTSNETVAQKGQQMKLYCIFSGNPIPTVLWKKDGKTVTTSNRVTLDNYNKTLVIETVEYEDAGLYSCEVNNTVGNMTHSINVAVNAAPAFTAELKSQNVTAKNNVTIWCKVDGRPHPQITWVHNGEPIDGKGNLSLSLFADNILIKDLRKEHTGNYGCNATNSIGYIYKDIYINVENAEQHVSPTPASVRKSGAHSLLVFTYLDYCLCYLACVFVLYINKPCVGQ